MIVAHFSIPELVLTEKESAALYFISALCESQSSLAPLQIWLNQFSRCCDCWTFVLFLAAFKPSDKFSSVCDRGCIYIALLLKSFSRTRLLLKDILHYVVATGILTSACEIGAVIAVSLIYHFLTTQFTNITGKSTLYDQMVYTLLYVKLVCVCPWKLTISLRHCIFHWEDCTPTLFLQRACLTSQ